ncbi:hypothetical protein L208DRAFT_1374290 [Tricholoma matsutake]|nr:hypothetical protein L208DRAFT_1374290 [Tricholoma matsutake 945]
MLGDITDHLACSIVLSNIQKTHLPEQTDKVRKNIHQGTGTHRESLTEVWPGLYHASQCVAVEDDRVGNINIEDGEVVVIDQIWKSAESQEGLHCTMTVHLQCQAFEFWKDRVGWGSWAKQCAVSYIQKIFGADCGDWAILLDLGIKEAGCRNILWSIWEFATDTKGFQCWADQEAWIYCMTIKIHQKEPCTFYIGQDISYHQSFCWPAYDGKGVIWKTQDQGS